MPLLTTRAGASSRAFGFGSAPTSSSSYVLLASGTITSGTTFTVTNIPGGYKNYVILGNGYTNSTATSMALDINLRNANNTDFNIGTKGMHAQGWSWNQGGFVANHSISGKALDNNTSAKWFEGMVFGVDQSWGGAWSEHKWGGASANLWGFGGGHINGVGSLPSPAVLNKITFTLSAYPSADPFSNYKYAIYGITGI